MIYNMLNNNKMININKRKIVFLGDSVTWNTNTAIAPLDKKWVSMMIARKEIYGINQGISGQQTNEMLANFSTTVLANKPDICFIEGGGNDVLFRTNDQSFSNIVSMVLLCKANNIKPVVISPLPEFYADYFISINPSLVGLQGDWENPIFLPKLRTELKNYCTNEKVDLLELYNIFLDSNGNQDLSLYHTDKLHPNIAGNAKIYELFCNYLMIISYP